MRSAHTAALCRIQIRYFIPALSTLLLTDLDEIWYKSSAHYAVTQRFGSCVKSGTRKA